MKRNPIAYMPDMIVIRAVQSPEHREVFGVFMPTTLPFYLGSLGPNGGKLTNGMELIFDDAR